MSFVGLHRIPFAFYRSGTSRGLFLLEKDLPPLGSTRDAILCQLMGSGHPQQLGGFGGGTGPTSKVAVVGPHEEPGSVTYNFAQCEVEIANVDKSHGDCGNMLAAVAPFALERGVAMGTEFETSTKLKIHSLNTGACYEANVPTTISSGKRCVQYLGNLEVPGAPGCAAPISLASLGVAGTQTGKLLPTDCPVDTLDFGLGKAKATLLDFARALVIVDAADILPKLGYSDLGEISLETVHADASLCDALEAMRRQASLMMGMGDCTGKDAPKLALVGPDGEGAEKGLCTLGGSLTCRYFVNPGRAEMHPTIAMTAAQARDVVGNRTDDSDLAKHKNDNNYIYIQSKIAICNNKFLSTEGSTRWDVRAMSKAEIFMLLGLSSSLFVDVHGIPRPGAWCSLPPSGLRGQKCFGERSAGL